MKVDLLKMCAKLQVEEVWKDSKTYPANDNIQTKGGIVCYEHFRTLKSPRWFIDPVSNIIIMMLCMIANSFVNTDAGYHDTLANSSLSLQPTGKFSTNNPLCKLV